MWIINIYEHTTENHRLLINNLCREKKIDQMNIQIAKELHKQITFIFQHHSQLKRKLNNHNHLVEQTENASLIKKDHMM